MGWTRFLTPTVKSRLRGAGGVRALFRARTGHQLQLGLSSRRVGRLPTVRSCGVALCRGERGARRALLLLCVDSE